MLCTSISSYKKRCNCGCTQKYGVPFFVCRGLRTVTLALHHRHAIACVKCKYKPAVCKQNIPEKRMPNPKCIAQRQRQQSKYFIKTICVLFNIMVNHIVLYENRAVLENHLWYIRMSITT